MDFKIFNSPDCFAVLKDPTLPKELEMRQNETRPPLRLLTGASIQPYLEDIAGRPSRITTDAKYLKGPLKSILELPKFFAALKDHMVDSSL